MANILENLSEFLEVALLEIFSMLLADLIIQVALFEIVKLVHHALIVFPLLVRASFQILRVEFADVPVPPLIEYLDKLGVEIDQLILVHGALLQVIVLGELTEAL